MPIDGLTGLSGLDDKRRTVLAKKLEITDLYELIMTDRHRIMEAFGRRGDRPTLEEVSRWQDEARRLRASSRATSVPTVAASGWEPVAHFVVAFEERRGAGPEERRIIAEQSEVEPEAAPQQRSEWSDWTCTEVCRWMLERVGVPQTPAEMEPDPISPGVQETPAEGAQASERRSTIQIERADLADSRGDRELVAGSRPVPQDRRVWTQPARLLVTLGGTPAGPGTTVVLQLGRTGGQKQTIVGRLDDGGRVAELELSGLAGGEYYPTLAAWRPDGACLPRVVKLPTVDVIGSGADLDSPP
jgi:hypothetical protein